MHPKDILAPVITVLHDFFEENDDLLEIDINERSLTHKLAELLQVRLRKWNIDCEIQSHWRRSKDPAVSS